MRHAQPRSGVLVRVLALILLVMASLAVLGASETAPCTIQVQPGESIQAAIDAAPEGAVICLAEGTWGESIKIEKSLTLWGAGAEKTVIDGIKDGYPVVWITTLEEETQTVSVKLEGLKVTGAEGWCADQDKGICASGVVVQGKAQVEITASTFSGNEYDGIRLRDSARAEITASTFSGNKGEGIWLLGSAQAEITGSTISGNREDGILLWGSAQAEITDSSFSGNGEDGILLSGSAKAEITGSSFSENRRTGILLWDSAQVEITDSSFSENWEGGIALGDSAKAEITDSSFSENWEDGILLWGSAQAEITDSSFSENRRDGMELGDSAQAVITDNLIRSNELVGIESYSTGPVTGSNNTMRENGVDLLGNLPAGLRLPLVQATEEEIQLPNPAYPTLQHAVDALLPGGELILGEGSYPGGVTIEKDLTIKAREGMTPRVEGGYAIISLVARTRVKLTGLLLTGGGEDGLDCGATSQAEITDSTFSGNKGEGIWLLGSAQAEITGSTISGNGDDGIDLRGSAQAEITGSTIFGNREDGIGLTDSAQAEITGSTFSGNNGDGIVLGGSVQATIEGNKIINNGDHGLVLCLESCGFLLGAETFEGHISGKQNSIPGPDEPDGNKKGAVCPTKLDFLMTEQGGKLDRQK